MPHNRRQFLREGAMPTLAWACWCVGGTAAWPSKLGLGTCAHPHRPSEFFRRLAFHIPPLPQPHGVDAELAAAAIAALTKTLQPQLMLADR